MPLGAMGLRVSHSLETSSVKMYIHYFLACDKQSGYLRVTTYLGFTAWDILCCRGEGTVLLGICFVLHYVLRTLFCAVHSGVRS